MERIPEPELMNAPEQVRAYAEADFSEPNGLFVERLRTLFPEGLSGHVLDLGCGPADICLRVARAYPRCQVWGVDGAEGMLEFARREIAREGLEGRVRLLHAHLPQMPLPRATYDAVLSNSLLHHLADPMALWQLILRYGRSDCPVLVMDLRRPESDSELEGIVERHAVGAPAVLRRDFTNSLRAAYRVEEVEQQLRRAGLASLRVEVGSDRHLLVHGRRP